MSVSRYTDLIVWQLASEFKKCAFGLIQSSPTAKRNFRFVDQLETAAGGAAKHIAEGFLRFAPLEFCRFLDYAVSSVGEAEGWIRDGIDRGYFVEADCAPAFQLAKRVSKGIIKLKASQLRYAEEQKARRKAARKTRNPNRNPEERG